MAKWHKDDDWGMPPKRPPGGGRIIQHVIPMSKKNAELLAAITRAEKPPQDRSVQPPKISAACKRGKHHQCFSKKCACPCNHPPLF